MDLNAPLGMSPPPPQPRRWLLVLAGASAAALAGLALALAWGDPYGGRPFAVVEVPPALPPIAPAPPTPERPAIEAVATLDATPTASTMASSRVPETTRTSSLEGGVLVHRGSVDAAVSEKPAANGPLIIDVSRALDIPFGRNKGAMPDTTKPADVSRARAPRVAIFVSGMGLDAAATRTATETMPAAVTLAFVPYGKDLPAVVEAARSRGHEVLLQLPMRNDGGTAPGPHALRVDAPAGALNTDLAWLMDRFKSYDGVSNLLGAAVTADTAAMTIVLKAARARHVFYLDDGTSRRSVATELAPDLGVDALKTDLVLDATSDPATVRANLDQLVAIAKRRGHAIGMASGLPEHLGTVARFAAELGGKGIDLVPVNAMVRGGSPAEAAASR